MTAQVIAFRTGESEAETLRLPLATPVSTIETERVRFYWAGRLAAGKITVIDGDPGLGKSTMTLEIAARISAGEALPGSEPMLPAGVLLLSAEDGEADTIRPRLEAAGADLRRVYIFKMRDESGNTFPAVIPDDLPALETQLAATRCKLIVIDPLMAFLSSERNANRDQDIRGALAPLAGMAERHGCAVILLRHLNKSLGSSPMYRGGGSIGIIGAARFGFIVAKDPEDKSGARRIVAPQKINIGPEPPALAYELEGIPGSDVARIRWLGEVSVNTADLLESVQSVSERTQRNEARVWLADMLRNGAVAAKDIQNDAKRDGISWRTLQRVKEDLGIVARRDGFGPGGKFVWSFPLVSNRPEAGARSPESRDGLSGYATVAEDDGWPS